MKTRELDEYSTMTRTTRKVGSLPTSTPCASDNNDNWGFASVSPDHFRKLNASEPVDSPGLRAMKGGGVAPRQHPMRSAGYANYRSRQFPNRVSRSDDPDIREMCPSHPTLTIGLWRLTSFAGRSALRAHLAPHTWGLSGVLRLQPMLGAEAEPALTYTLK